MSKKETVLVLLYHSFWVFTVLAFFVGWGRDRAEAIRRGYAVKNHDFFSSDLIWLEDEQ